MLESCQVNEPPELYGTIEQQRVEVVDAWVDQTYNLHKCNVDKKALRKWKAEQEAVYGAGR